jgi:hypothetical protein
MVFEAVDNRGKLDAQFAHARAGDVRAFVITLGTVEDDRIPDVALHLPYIAGVCFEDVNRVKRNLLAVLLVEFVEGRNLPPEGRSGIAAKDQYHRLLASE